MIPWVLGSKESGEGGQNSLTAPSQVDHQHLSARKFKINQGIVLFLQLSFIFPLASRQAFAFSKNNRHFHELFI